MRSILTSSTLAEPWFAPRSGLIPGGNLTRLQEVVSPQEFVAELNRRLAEHSAYRYGMCFELSDCKHSSSRGTSITWRPRAEFHPFVEICLSVKSMFGF